MEVLSMERKSAKVRLEQALINILFTALCLTVVLPILLVFVSSFATEESILTKGYSFFPENLSLNAYKNVFSDNSVFSAFFVSISVTVIGTVLSLIVNAMCAFTLASQKLKYRNVLAMVLFLPTLFNPGILPWYYLIREVYHLHNTVFVLFLPSLVTVNTIFIMRNYFKSIPESVIESAEIDGAKDFLIFFRIIVPLSVPMFATFALFSALGFWNDYTLALWFIDPKYSYLYPLQYYIFQIWSKFGDTGSGVVGYETTYLATMFISMGPLLILLPFVQKHFVKGLLVGSVKG